MNQPVLYTIGHGSRKAADFLALLRQYGISYLADVRSQPYSRFHSHFSQAALRPFLESNGIRYVFMGDQLGGRPADPACYGPDGRIDYEKVQHMDFFRQGIRRLRSAAMQGLPVALMCAESNPAHCHRSRLIGKALSRENVLVQHIDENGRLKEQASLAKHDLFSQDTQNQKHSP